MRWGMVRMRSKRKTKEGEKQEEKSVKVDRGRRGEEEKE